jgi:hypothetical protein
MQLRAVSSAPPVGVPSCAVDPLYSPTVLALLGGPSRCDRSIGFPHRKRWTGPSRSANLAPGRHVRLRDVTPTYGRENARARGFCVPPGPDVVPVRPTDLLHAMCCAVRSASARDGPCVAASGAEHGRPPSTYAARSGCGAWSHACMHGRLPFCTRNCTYT